MIQDPILVVDDEPSIRELLREALEMDGYAVDTAASVPEALEKLDSRFFPVLLTDLNMPGGLTGFDLIAEVKARTPRTLCVVLTGFASTDNAIAAVKQGAYDFVQKPFKIHEVEAVLDRALEHGSLLRRLESYQQDLETRVTTRMIELRTFQNEVARLDELLLVALGESEVGRRVAPFGNYLRERFHADGCTCHLADPDAEASWRTLCHEGIRPPTDPRRLPLAFEMQEAQEWRDEGGYPDSFLVPLRVAEELLGVVVIGFEARTSFDLDDPLLHVWRRHLEAALWSLRLNAARGNAG